MLGTVENKEKLNNFTVKIWQKKQIIDKNKFAEEAILLHNRGIEFKMVDGTDIDERIDANTSLDEVLTILIVNEIRFIAGIAGLSYVFYRFGIQS